MSDPATLWAACPQLSNIHASADGRWAFWCWQGMTETDEVWCAPIDGSSPPSRLTHGQDHFLIRDVSSDGRRLLLAQSVNACEHDHLLLLDRGTGQLTQLTPRQSSHYVYGGCFSKDATKVYFQADFDYANGEVTPGSWLWQLDLASGQKTCLARADTPPHFTIGPRLSPDGTRLLWHRSEGAPGLYQLWVVGTDGSNPNEALNLGPTNSATGTWIGEDRIALSATRTGATSWAS